FAVRRGAVGGCHPEGAWSVVLPHWDHAFRGSRARTDVAGAAARGRPTADGPAGQRTVAGAGVARADRFRYRGPADRWLVGRLGRLHRPFRCRPARTAPPVHLPDVCRPATDRRHLWG